MKGQSKFKIVLFFFLQLLGASLGFIISLTVANALLPLSESITSASATGFLSMSNAILFNCIVNAGILLWAARRSSFKGLRMWMQLLVLSFGVQTLQTQIETAYFISAFPLLKGNFELYRLVLRGFVTSLVFTSIVVLLSGGFGKKMRAETNFIVTADHAVKVGSWLAAVYFVLYMVFGYYVAWQSQELRLFYGGPAELNSFINQFAAALMERPELPIFQYFRGVLWILCLIPLFKGFSGSRGELVVLSALALAYLTSASLAFPNPLMPAEISLSHFWEMSVSMGIFGAMCAWFVPQEKTK